MAPPANAAKTINAVIILYIIIYYINLPDTLCIKVFILFYFILTLNHLESFF